MAGILWFSLTTLPPESLDELRLYTAAQMQTTVDDDGVTTDETISPPSNSRGLLFDESDTPPPMTEESEVVIKATSKAPVPMCPIVVCPWNDTIGYFTTTSAPPDEDSGNSTLPCRGDNPTGCTPFWTSSRDETLSSLHSTYSSTESAGASQSNFKFAALGVAKSI